MEQLGSLPLDRITFPYLGIELDVKSVCFTIGNFEIKWYGVMIGIGLLLALKYCFSKVKNFGIDGSKVIDTVFAGMIGGIICARVYYLIFHHDNIYTIGDVFNIRKGGLAIYGGIIGAFLFGIIVAKKEKIRILPLIDLAGMGFLIGQGVGRWGNFFNHEAFGMNTSLPWGMSSGRIQSYLAYNQADIFAKTGITVDPYLPVHPCFLYESLWCLLGFLLLHLYMKKRRYDGEMFLMYICWYGFERMFVEGLRTDSLYLGSVRISQVLAACLFVISLILLVYFRVRFSKRGYPVLYVNTEESKEILRRAAEAEKAEEERIKNKKNKTRELSADEKIIDDDENENTGGNENGTDN